MRIQFKTEGGFAYIPGLNKPVTIDLDELPEQEADELQQLLQTARFFELPQRLGMPSPKAADMQQYKITVERQEGSHTVQLSDMSDDPHLRKLVDVLKAKTSRKRVVAKK
jgi:hypothetical protein